MRRPGRQSLKSDALYESTLALLSKSTQYLSMLPIWLLREKAALKHEVASRVEVDAAMQPFDDRLVEMLGTTQVRPRVLCTPTASTSPSPSGAFDLVIASNALRSSSAFAKRTFRRRFASAGNEDCDLKPGSAPHGW